MMDSVDDILPFTDEKARTGVCYAFYIVVEQIVFDLLRRDVMDENLHKHTANWAH